MDYIIREFLNALLPYYFRSICLTNIYRKIIKSSTNVIVFTALVFCCCCFVFLIKRACNSKRISFFIRNFATGKGSKTSLFIVCLIYESLSYAKRIMCVSSCVSFRVIESISHTQYAI